MLHENKMMHLKCVHTDPGNEQGAAETTPVCSSVADHAAVDCFWVTA